MQEMQRTRVRSLGQEDPLAWEMATHSSILAWKISWTEEPGGLRPTRHKESDTTEHACAQRARSPHGTAKPHPVSEPLPTLDPHPGLVVGKQ